MCGVDVFEEDEVVWVVMWVKFVIYWGLVSLRFFWEFWSWEWFWESLKGKILGVRFISVMNFFIIYFYYLSIKF